jgi:hypothetical protein
MAGPGGPGRRARARWRRLSTLRPGGPRRRTGSRRPNPVAELAPMGVGRGPSRKSGGGWGPRRRWRRHLRHRSPHSRHPASRRSGAGWIPELVAVGEEDSHEGSLRVRPPHHGASGEADRPQGVHGVSCAAARNAGSRSRYSLTIAYVAGVRQRIPARSDPFPDPHPAKSLDAHGVFHTAK